MYKVKFKLALLVLIKHIDFVYFLLQGKGHIKDFLQVTFLKMSSVQVKMFLTLILV